MPHLGLEGFPYLMSQIPNAMATLYLFSAVIAAQEAAMSIRSLVRSFILYFKKIKKSQNLSSRVILKLAGECFIN